MLTTPKNRHTNKRSIGNGPLGWPFRSEYPTTIPQYWLIAKYTGDFAVVRYGTPNLLLPCYGGKSAKEEFSLWLVYVSKNITTVQLK